MWLCKDHEDMELELELDEPLEEEGCVTMATVDNIKYDEFRVGRW